MFASRSSGLLRCVRRALEALTSPACIGAAVLCLSSSAYPQSPPSPRQAHAEALPSASQATPSLLLPVAVAYDSAGNLFFADSRLHQVLELTLAGTWSVVAGSGEQGFAGDGGLATAAMLNSPRGLAIAKDGTLYIADTGNQRIRAVVNGIISTVAGSGKKGYSGDGTALQTALRDPTAIALDASGDVLFCDTGNQRIRRLRVGMISTIAGSGVQGFSGDGGLSTSAELDTPLGIAARTDGAILIADTHNQRIRALHTDGTISTYAGIGKKGFGGDGGQAALAELNMPFGVASAPDGTVLIADAGNQRIRTVSPQSIISTVAGNGLQGAVTDGVPRLTADLNSPRAIGLQLQGQPVFADSRNAVVRELANDEALYTLALLTAPRTSRTVLSALPTVVYGTSATTVSVTGGAATPQGVVALLDGGQAVRSAPLAAGQAAFDLSTFQVGGHALSARYAGDGLNAASSSVATDVTVSPASAAATANSASAIYGASLPALTGSLSGILLQDAGNVRAVFLSTAGAQPDVGSYPITAVLSGQGSANYVLTMGANSGSLVISPAASSIALAPVNQTYAGLPLRLSASVASSTSGIPGGSVDFLDGSAVVGTASAVNGSATATILTSTEGAHVITARYNGSTNFLLSQSLPASVTIAAMPDFSLAMNSAGQSVQGGSVASFNLSVLPQNGSFTGAVVLSVSGLPQGAVASFSPASVVPGSRPSLRADGSSKRCLARGSKPARVNGTLLDRLSVLAHHKGPRAPPCSSAWAACADRSCSYSRLRCAHDRSVGSCRTVVLPCGSRHGHEPGRRCCFTLHNSNAHRLLVNLRHASGTKQRIRRSFAST